MPEQAQERMSDVVFLGDYEYRDDPYDFLDDPVGDLITELEHDDELEKAFAREQEREEDRLWMQEMDEWRETIPKRYETEGDQSNNIMGYALWKAFNGKSI